MAIAERDLVDEEMPRTAYDFDGTLEAACDEEPARNEWVAETFGESFAPPDPKSVEAEDVADWVLRKVLESRAQQARMKAASAARLKREQSREQGLLYSLGTWLKQFVEVRKGARKSVLLESGTVALRARKGKIEIRDPAALALWALQNAPYLLTHTLKATLPFWVDAANWSMPEGTKISIEIPPSADTLRSVDETIQYATKNWNAVHTFEVKNADAQGYFELLGDVPYACEYVEAGDELYLSEPRTAKGAA